MTGLGRVQILRAGQIFRRLHRLLCKHAAGTEVIGPRDNPDIAPLSRASSISLEARVEGPGLLLKAGEQISQIKGSDEGNKIGRDR